MMKKVSLPLCLLMFLSISCSSQNNLQENVFKKINSEREKSNLSPVLIQEPFELASAQHGCWIAIYNRFSNLSRIELPETEVRLKMISTFTNVEDRVKNFSNKNFENITEMRLEFYEEPNSTQISIIISKFLDISTKNFGFWVVKFIDSRDKPIWYLVCLKSN